MPGEIRIARVIQRRVAVLVALLVAPAAFAQAGEQSGRPGKLLTLDAIIGPGRVDFSGEYATGLEWFPDGQHYFESRKGEPLRVNAFDGTEAAAYEHAALRAALVADEVDERSATRLSRSLRGFRPSRTTTLFTHEDRAYVYDFATGALQRLPLEAAHEAQELALSPRGRFATFVRGNNLFTLDRTTGRVSQRTQDGSDTLLNGILDWVYQEEIYGRGDFTAFWWREDDAYIAYLQLDESDVPIYVITDETKVQPDVERQRYPKAGEPNPRVRLAVLAAEGAAPVWIDLSGYGDEEILVVRVGWAPDGKLIFQVQDRRQTWLDLNEADPQSGRVQRLLRETTPAWVNVLGPPNWLPDGGFLWLSERDGYAHVYHHARDGRLVGRLTEGDWKVREIHGIDPKTGWVYLSGAFGAGNETHVYRVRLEGGRAECLTEPGFSHRAEFSPAMKHFIDTYGNITTPPRVALRDASGQFVRHISENPVQTLADYELGEVEFLRVPARDGYLLDAVIIRPPGSEGRNAPVFCPIYGGPDTPSVSNGWQGQGFLMNQLMAQRGCIVWICDPRTAHGVATVGAWQALERLGQQELADMEDGLRWLMANEKVDPTRMGIGGYSYGGFLTTYALTNSDLFTFGVAGGPVTDWRNYDTIYTERYMRTPEDNPDGYATTAVVNDAKDLIGKLLLVHGAMDDNVHLSNTMQFVDALQRAGKTFDLMIYPGNRHAIHRNSRHWHETRLRFALQRMALSDNLTSQSRE